MTIEVQYFGRKTDVYGYNCANSAFSKEKSIILGGKSICAWENSGKLFRDRDGQN